MHYLLSTTVLRQVAAFTSAENAASAVEWSVLAAGIAAVAVFGIRNLGLTVAGLFDRAVTQMGSFF